MNGVGLFLWMPSEDGEKERMLGQLQGAFQELGVEILQLNIASEGAFEKLGEIDRYFAAQPPGRKRFVFSIDGDGFGLTLKMDGLWVDNIQYNVFTYLTGHPSQFGQRLAGINSWYISILNSQEEGVAYIEEHYPHLDGIEYMAWPREEGEDGGNLAEGVVGGMEKLILFAEEILNRCK